MRGGWALLVADLRREYRIRPAQIPDLGAQEFRGLLIGLSDASRWRRWAAEQPVEVTSPDEARALIAQM